MLDTHLLLWAAGVSNRLSATARALLEGPDSTLHFSAASLWEITIKASLGRDSFKVDPAEFRHLLMNHGYAELPITSAHAIGVKDLPHIHGDPFDRLLVAQAISEGLLLLTADSIVAQYPGPVRLV